MAYCDFWPKYSDKRECFAEATGLPLSYHRDTNNLKNVRSEDFIPSWVQVLPELSAPQVYPSLKWM